MMWGRCAYQDALLDLPHGLVQLLQLRRDGQALCIDPSAQKNCPEHYDDMHRGHVLVVRAAYVGHTVKHRSLSYTGLAIFRVQSGSFEQ